VQVSAPFGKYAAAAQVLGFTHGEPNPTTNSTETK
jgi:hypothetical protein